MMAQHENGTAHRLLVWGTAIVVSHFVVALWHLWLVVRLQSNFPPLAVGLLILFNLVPVAGVVALAKRGHKAAAILITVPLAVAFVIGIYAHFLSAGTDNVLHMRPSELTLPFQVSAALLVLLEGLGCWVGLTTFAHSWGRRQPPIS